MHCSLFDADFCHDKPEELAAKCLRLTNLKVEIPTTKTAIHPWITEMLNKGYGKFPPPSKKAAE